EEVRTGTARPAPRSDAERDAVRRAYESFAAADRGGLVGGGEVKLGLAWLAILRGDPAGGERHLRAAGRLYPRPPRDPAPLAASPAAARRVPGLARAAAGGGRGVGGPAGADPSDGGGPRPPGGPAGGGGPVGRGRGPRAGLCGPRPVLAGGELQPRGRAP